MLDWVPRVCTDRYEGPRCSNVTLWNGIAARTFSPEDVQHTYVYIIVRADTALFISQFLTYSFGFPNDMIYCPGMAYDMWHDTTCQTSLITPHPTEAGWLYVSVAQIMCDDMMWWCNYLFGFRVFYAPLIFQIAHRRLIFIRRWRKQNSVARRLDLEDRDAFINNHVFLINLIYYTLFRLCLVNCVTSDMWVSRPNLQDFHIT